VVADSARARLFEAESPTAPLTELEDMLNPAGRLRDQDLNADAPGRSFDSFGEGRHAMGKHNDPQRQEAIRFAQRLAEHLESAFDQQRVARVHLVVAPAFLGLLRAALSEKLQGVLESELDANLVRHTVKDIRSHLPERL
jgi:protein required for attachment to host cells